MTPVTIDELISDLSADLRPVRRLRPPLVRATGWLAVVVALALVLAAVGDPKPMLERLRSVPDMWLAMLGSVLTTALGAIAVFQLGLPDRRPAWALLPVPGLLLWLGATGLGCLRSWSIPGLHPASAEEAQSCIGFILTLSLPLSIALFVMLRRGFSLRPDLTAAIGGVTVAAAAASLLNLFHPFDAGATDFAVHLVAIGIVIVGNRMLAQFF